MRTPALPTALMLASILAIASLAVAQPGPTPGTNPVDYAAGHARDEAASAIQDPASYASGAFAGKVQQETGTAAYVACWEAWEATGTHVEEVCDDFFAPPEQLETRAEAEGREAAQDTTDAVKDTRAEAFDQAAQARDAAENSVRNPHDLPQEIRRIVSGLRSVLDTLSGGLKNAFLDGLVLSWNGLEGMAQGAVSVGDSLEAGLGLSAQGLGDMGTVVGDGLAASQDALAQAGSATAQGAQTTATNIAQGMEEAAQSLASTVTSWFASPQEPKAETGPGPSVQPALPVSQEDGLVGEILGLVA